MNISIERVCLRAILASDLPQMYELQCDPESNRMALMIPRTKEAFDSHWAKALIDPKTIARAIIVDDKFVGLVSCFPVEDQDHIGYWIDRALWGQGIASQALHLLLKEIAQRPLFATVATSNCASRRILQKCGFVIERFQHSPASERYQECEEAVLVLK